MVALSFVWGACDMFAMLGSVAGRVGMRACSVEVVVVGEGACAAKKHASATTAGMLFDWLAPKAEAAGTGCLPYPRPPGWVCGAVGCCALLTAAAAHRCALLFTAGLWAHLSLWEAGRLLPRQAAGWPAAVW